MRLYYQVFETNYGWQLALSLSVLINVNLAILNLLPFPVLDGGHIVLAIIEGIRRKPINVHVLEAVQRLVRCCSSASCSTSPSLTLAICLSLGAKEVTEQSK